MSGKAFFLLCLLTVIGATYALQISEIMYNPGCYGDKCEWLELYNNDTETHNLSDMELFVKDVKRPLLPINETLIPPGSYAVVVKNLENFSAEYPNMTALTAIGNWTNLANNGSSLLLRNSTFIFDNITYEPVAAEGRSLCRINDTFVECIPTPGAPAEWNTSFENNQTNATPPSDNTGDFACTVSIETGSVFESGVKMNYDIIVNESVEVEYWVEDIFGNVVKEPYRSNSTMNREWTPPDIEGSEAYVIFSRAACGNASKMVIVKGPQMSLFSSISIGPAEEAKFGETAMIKLSVYRGDTDRYAIDVFVKSSSEKISSVTTFHAKNKFRYYNISLPIQLKPNCNSEFSDGTYDVVAEGLNITISAPITVRGTSSSNCKTVTVSTGSSGSYVAPAKISPYDIDYPDSVYVGEEFSVVLKVNATAGKNLTVYSYVFRDNKPVSEGFSDKWSGTWTANKIITDRKEIILRNRIEDGTTPGIYNLRVKIKSDKEEDITKEIEIKERPGHVPVASVNNTTVSTIATTPATGFATLSSIKSRNMEKYVPMMNILKLLVCSSKTSLP
jgi:hypothetical protein